MFNWLRKKFTPENYMQSILDKKLEREVIDVCKKRMQRILDLDISILAKFLFSHESMDWATKAINILSKEEKYKLSQELELIDLEENSGRIYMYNHINELCKQ